MSLNKRIKSLKGRPDLIVTPLIEDFLHRTPEGAIWDDDGYELFRSITVPMFGSNSVREGRFGASSRGKCLRAQLWKFMGMPERTILDADLLNLFNDGKWRHMRWQMMLVQSGAATHVEFPLAAKKYRLTSSVDALHSTENYLIEVKGDRNMSRLLEQEGGVVRDHNLQIHTMMLMTGWDTCVYIMEDKSSQVWREVVVKRDPKMIREVRDELEVLNTHVEDRSLPEPLPACKAKEGPYRSCPFAKPCLERWNGGRGGDYWPDDNRDWKS